MNLVAVKRFGNAGILYDCSVFGKCVFALSIGVLFVVFLYAQLYLIW